MKLVGKISIIIIICIIPIVTHAGLFSGITPKLFNKTINEIKTELGVIRDNQMELNNRMIAYDRSTTIGRDMTVTNDTKLMRYIIGGLIGLCSSLIAALVTFIKLLFKFINEKKEWKGKYYNIAKQIETI